MLLVSLNIFLRSLIPSLSHFIYLELGKPNRYGGLLERLSFIRHDHNIISFEMLKESHLPIYGYLSYLKPETRTSFNGEESEDYLGDFNG